MPLPLKSFTYLRHGETDWNKRHICMGQADIPLNETSPAGRNSNEKKPSLIVSSSLKRAFQTTQIIGKELSIPVKTHEGLKEAC